MPRTGLALVHKGEEVVSARDVGRGGVNVAINIGGGGGGLGDMTPEQFGRLVSSAATRLLRESGGFKGLVKDTARRGL